MQRFTILEFLIKNGRDGSNGRDGKSRICPPANFATELQKISFTFAASL